MNLEKTGVFLKRTRFGHLAVMAILLNAVLLMILVMPRRSAIGALQGEYASLRQLVAKDQKDVRELKARVDRLQRAQSDLKKIYSEILLPRKEGVLAIRLELEQLAHNLQVKRGDPAYNYEDLSKFRLQQFKLSVPVDGNYRNIRKFINGIERSKHFLILDRVDLSSDKQPDSLSLDFRLSTYLVMDEP